MTCLTSNVGFILYIAFFMFPGCTHTIPVLPSSLSTLSQYSEDTPRPLYTGEKTMVLSSLHKPVLKLTLDRSCSMFQTLARTCDKRVVVPLSEVSQVSEDQFLLKIRTSKFLKNHYKTMAVSLSEVTDASLKLRGYTPSSWRPRFGLGLAVAGPSGIAALQVQYLIAPWIGVEAGMLPAADLLSGFIGTRFRPIQFSVLRPFVGGFANYTTAFNANTAESETISAIGPRFGLDLEIAKGKVLVSAEVDLAHPLEGDRAFFGNRQGEWLLWGGGSLSYFW